MNPDKPGELIDAITYEFVTNANTEIASGQKAYMKNLFEFYGIKAPVRQEIQKPFFNRKFLPPKSELEIITKTLWEKPQREYQYFAQEFVQCYAKQFEKKDVRLFEFMINHKSWWDTVDFIASKPVGEYFKTFPGERDKHIDHWIKSGNIWLQMNGRSFSVEIQRKC